MIEAPLLMPARGIIARRINAGPQKTQHIKWQTKPARCGGSTNLLCLSGYASQARAEAYNEFAHWFDYPWE